MMFKHLLLLSVIVLFSLNVHSQKDTVNQDTLYHRDYSFMGGLYYDINNSTINTRSGGKLLNDAYLRWLGPKIKNQTARNILGGFWSFFAAYSSMIWSHEFGHMLRASQVGGRFSIEKYSFPIIFGKMDLPPNHTHEDALMSIVGGFEANYMTIRDIQSDFYRHGSLYNDELSLSFAHRLMYPIYFTLISPVDPSKTETWINTMGDPVHYIKPLWQRGGNEVFTTGNMVHPDLEKLYKQAALLSFFWNLTDWNFYREAIATFGNDLEGKNAKYLIGNEINGWSYGTLFNTSALGPELSLINYFRLNKKLYSLSFKYGFPYQNNGLGLMAYDVLNHDKVNVDVMFDFWQQEFYGNGWSGVSNVRYAISPKFECFLQAGWKSEGYLMGRPLDKGFIGFVGLKYTLHH